MILFTHNVKMIKGAANKNGDVDGTRKRTTKAKIKDKYPDDLHS